MNNKAINLTSLQAELLADRLFELSLRDANDLAELDYTTDHIERLVEGCPTSAGTFHFYADDLELLKDEVENLLDLNDDPWEMHRPGAVRSLENLQKKLLNL